ncbi:MAG TPA: hypothetical protein PLJ38_10310, partial [bacterium]|nr:hypothetical protein [bacterium]
DFNSDNQKIITIEFMPDINLFFGAILNKAELGFPFETAKKLWMKFLATLNLTLCGLLGIFLFQKIGCEDFNRRLPVVCGIIAIIFAIGIFSLWYFQRNYGMSSPRLVKNYVSDKGSLNKFIENEKKMVNQNLIPHYSFLPTGILVQSIKISAINEAQISGIVWQKVPKELVGKIKEGVNFPDAVTIQLSEIYRTTDNSGALIIGWSFKAILRQNFESRLFPFEQLNLQVKIDQKNLLDKIKFIPDLDSYDEYTTSSNPFTTRDIVVPGWLVKQTYFTINKSEYSTNFGQSDSNIKNNNSLLTLNIVLQRNFLSNFFSTFLPFFVLLLLAFIALLFSSGMEDKKKLLSFRPSNMQGIASGFLLFLVFSIVNIRRDAISNRLLYIEYLYFFTFFMLLTLVLAVVHISDGRKNFFGYQDGLIIKSIYWPFVFGSIFYITYFIFL